MPDPIIELIAAEIAARIAEITETNGFNQDLIPIRPKRVDYKPQSPVNNTVLIVQDDEDEWAGGQANTKQAWEQPFNLQAIVVDSDDATTAIDIKRNRVRADIVKKLMEDNTRGGNANDTVIKPSFNFNDGEGFTGIQINIVIQYRTKINDPYTK